MYCNVTVVSLPVALPHTLTEMMTHLHDPEVGIVHQLPFTLPDTSFAGVLDSVSVVMTYSHLALLNYNIVIFDQSKFILLYYNIYI